jgi:hypothetical protein
MSTPQHDSTSDAPSPNTPQGETFPRQAASREVPQPPPPQVHNASAVPTVLDAAQSSTPTHHVHDAQHPHMHETVIGAAQNVLSRLASSFTPQAAPVHQHVQDVPRERSAEAPMLTDLPQRTAEPTSQGPAPTSISSHGGRSGRARPITPPPGVARIARSYPAVPETTHPRPFRGIHSVHRRTTGPFADSVTAYQAYDDRDPVRLPMTTSLLSWPADGLASVPSSVPRKECWSALRSNHQIGDRRTVQGHESR